MKRSRLDLFSDVTVMAAISGRGEFLPLPKNMLERKIAGELREVIRDGKISFIAIAPPDSAKDLPENIPDGCILLQVTDFDDLTDQIIAERRERRKKNAILAIEPMEEDFVERPKEAKALLAPLLEGGGKTVGITAALRGAGGYGKTVLANWLCYQEDVRDIFCDGILWLELGETPNMVSKLDGLVQMLTQKPSGLTDIHALQLRIGELIGERHMLLVIDDVWREQDMRALNIEAPNLSRLITTRLDDVLPRDCEKIAVDAMQPDEAVELLTVGMKNLGVSEEQLADARPDLEKLAARLGEWALLLALAGGQLRNELEAGDSLANAINFVSRLYDEEGLTAFDPENEDDRTRVSALSIGVSLRYFNKDEQARFLELALFPEDENIPIRTIARLWKQTAGLSELKSGRLLRKLKKFALLMGLDLASGAVRLHDVMRKFLRDRAGKKGLQKQNRTWLKAYKNVDGRKLERREQRYYYQHLPMHLHEAGKRKKLDALLLNVEWMLDKLEMLGKSQPLIADYQAYAPYDGKTTPQALIGRALGQSAGPLSRDQRQLVPQLLGRLRDDMGPEIEGIIKQARSLAKPCTLIPCHPSLTPANSPLIYIFEDDTYQVRKVTFYLDGRHIVSGGGKTLRLWDVKTGESQVLKGHTLGIIDYAISPDGRQIVSGSLDKTLRLWDVQTGESQVLKGHMDWVVAVAFSPDGRQIVSGSKDNTLRLWDVKTGESRMLKGHTKAVRNVAFSPDGRQIVSGSKDNTLRLWDVNTSESRVLKGHTHSVTSMAISPDGRQIVSGSLDKTLRLWDVQTGESQVLKGHMDWVVAVAFSPDGRQIVSGAKDSTLRLWDVKTGESRMLKGHTCEVRNVAFSPDGRQIVSGARDKTLRLWDVKTNESRVLKGHTNEFIMVAFSPDGRQIVSAANDKTFRLWDAQMDIKRCFKSHTAPVCEVAFSPDGRRIVYSGRDQRLRLWEVQTGKSRILKGRIRQSSKIAFSPNGRQIISVDPPKLWDVQTGEGRMLEGHVGSVSGGNFSPDGKKVLMGDLRKTPRLWDVETGTSEHLKYYERMASGLACSSSGRHVVLRASNNTLCLWDVQMGKGRMLKGHTDGVLVAAFSPDGERIVSGGRDKMLWLWDVQTGKGRILKGHTGEVLVVAFSPDGRRIVSGARDQSPRLWDVQTGTSRALKGHTGAVFPVAFSPDGGHIVSGADDMTLRLWGVTTGQEIASFKAEGPIRAMALSPDGRMIAAGDKTGAVHLLDIIIDEADKARWLKRFS